MAQVARNMGLTRQSVRRSVYKLEDKGLVVFSENPAHQRAKLIELTPEGRKVLGNLKQIDLPTREKEIENAIDWQEVFRNL